MKGTVTCLLVTRLRLTVKVISVVTAGLFPSTTDAASDTETCGEASSSVIVAVPVASPRVALAGFWSVTRNVSFSSSSESWVVCTSTVTLVAPAAMVAVRADVTAV